MDNLQEDIKYLINLIDNSGWNKEIPQNLCPMSYVTLSYESDKKIQDKLNEIKKRYLNK